MLEPLTTLFDSIMGNIIGGSGNTPLWITALIIIMLCVAILLTARVGFDVAMIIVAPGIIIASFAGIIPMLGFGVMVIMLAVFWTGILLAMTR